MEKNSETTQMNITIPKEWKRQLKDITIESAYKERTDLTYHDIVRRALQQFYNLTPNNNK